jgi:hypothetical protein
VSTCHPFKRRRAHAGYIPEGEEEEEEEEVFFI